MKVDFYIVNDTAPLVFERELFRICHKLYESYRQILILCESSDQCEHLNQALWTMSPESFLPHEVVQKSTGPQTKAPILLADFQFFLPDHVLINCTHTFPIDADRYTQIIELIPPDESKKALARARYKHYQHPDRQAQLNCHFV